MCTMTIVPLPAGKVRIAFNRDEQKSRPKAIPPEVVRLSNCDAIMPLDPVSGGTWLAANDMGLVLAILNVNVAKQDGALIKRSRGKIIPALLDCESPVDALARFEHTINYREYSPFRLVIIGKGIVADLRWDSQQLMVKSRLLGGTPLLFTSSGLGDHLVEGVRRELFEMLFNSSAEDWDKVQYQFHRHHWPDREPLSINMNRDDAHTVSHAVIEIEQSALNFRYFPESFEQNVEPLSRSLILEPAGAR